MTRLVMIICALLAACTAFSQVNQQPLAVADRSQMAPDCLVAGEFADVDRFCGIVERLLGAIAEKPQPGMMREVFGQMMRNPAMAGVALDRPLRFFWMNPKVHSQPLVCQFTVADAAALARELKPVRPAPEGHPAGAMEFANGAETTQQPEPRPQPGYLLVRDGTATVYFSASACESLLRWQSAHATPVEYRVAGQLRCRLAVQHILAAYGEEYAHEIQAMRDRMREALERLGASPDAEESIRNAQGQLDTASGLTKQMEIVDAGIALSDAAAVLRAEAVPLDGSALAKLIQAHPRGSTELLRNCPATVDIAFAQNVSVAGTASGLLLNRLGLPGVGRAIGSAAATQTLFGLVLPRDQGSLLSLLFMRTNQTPETAAQFWSRLAQEGQGSLFGLRPVEPPAGATVHQLAEITIDETKTGPDRVRALRRVVGERPMAAQELRAGRSILAVGPAPLDILAQVRALEQDAATSLAKERAFNSTIELLPDAPNLLLYASPAALADWLKLADIPSVAPGAKALGCAAACSLREDGRVEAGVVLALDQLTVQPTPTKP